MNSTKILCTLGPATDPPGTVAALARAGMNAARLNFPHGDAAAQKPRYDAVRAAERELGAPLAIMADLQGPKIRVGRFPQGPATLAAGAMVVLESGDGPCSADHLFVDYPELAASARAGADIFLADGLFHLTIQRVDGPRVHCRIERGGTISDHKGVNLPGVPLRLPSLTEKDLRDAIAAAQLGCDLIALSFVRSAGDIGRLRDHLHAHQFDLPIVAKLERPEALDQLEAIVMAADAVMVARGDLGVEVGVARVPILQKQILALARRLAKPSIVATQMLESMTAAPLPTRAEAADVANAILDGADAVMLSEETAAGRYPLETVRMMRAIADQAEPLVAPCAAGEGATGEPIAEAVADGVRTMAGALSPKAIVAYTESGFTARLLAKCRPAARILALSPNEAVRRRCSLYYGCDAAPTPPIAQTDEIFLAADRVLLARGLAAPGDCVLIVAGLPFSRRGATNLIHAHVVAAPGGA